MTVAIKGGLRPAKSVSDDSQVKFRTINFIMALPGEDTVNWGVRTLDNPSDTNFLYVSVRRVCDMVQRDIKKGLQSYLSEPHEESTWRKIRAAVTDYLARLFLMGALKGDTKDSAFVVRIGKSVTMTEEDIARGRRLEVGNRRCSHAACRVLPTGFCPGNESRIELWVEAWLQSRLYSHLLIDTVMDGAYSGWHESRVVEANSIPLLSTL